jgi:hypothetical protein
MSHSVFLLHGVHSDCDFQVCIFSCKSSLSLSFANVAMMKSVKKAFREL